MQDTITEFCKKKLTDLAADTAFASVHQGLVSLLAAGDSTHELQLAEGKCQAPMSTTLRDAALQYLDTDQTFVEIDTRHVLSLGRTPLASLTKSAALSSMLSTLKRYGKPRLEAESVLLSLRTSTTLPLWSPQVEAELKVFAEGKQVSALKPEQAILMLTNPSWRTGAGFVTDKISGASFQMQDALRNQHKESANTFSSSDVKKRGSIDNVCTLVLDVGGAWETADGVNLRFAPEMSPPSIGACAFLPAHPCFVELKPETLVLWIETDYVWARCQAIPHEIVDPDVVDAVLMPSGSVALTIARRNKYTGGYEDSETTLLRFDGSKFVEATATESEVAEAEKAEEARAAGKQIDFRDHGSLIALIARPDGTSLVCFSDQVLSEHTGIAVAALGCPQDYFVVFADGTVKRCTGGYEKQIKDSGRGIYGAALASGI